MELETRNPYDGKIVSKIKITGENEAMDIFKNSRKEQKSWSKNLESRISYMKDVLIPNLSKGKLELADLMSKEMGKV